jgi:hypothetical protein
MYPHTNVGFPTHGPIFPHNSHVHSFTSFQSPITQNQHNKISSIPNLKKWKQYGLALKPFKDFHHIPMLLTLDILLSTSTNCSNFFCTTKIQEKQKPYNLL